MRSRLAPLFAFLLLFATLPAAAQISTDRPGLGFAPSTVDRGIFQVELGIPDATANSISEADFQTFSFPVALRFGITDQIEARLATSVLEILRSDVGRSSDTDVQEGFNALSVGAKIAVLDGSGGGPPLALIPAVVIPTEEGSVTLRADAVAGFALTDALGLTTVAGLSLTDGNVQGALAGVLGTGFTDVVSGYAEVGAYPSEFGTPAYVGAGVLVLVSPDAQIDLAFDYGLTDDASDWLFGLGFSFRI